MNIQRLKHAEAMRQEALDYINEHPGAITPDIIKALNWHIQSGSSRLEHMACERRELSRIPVAVKRVNSLGFTHETRTYAYTALVTKTTPAEVVIEGIREAGRKYGREAAGKPKVKKQNEQAAGKWTARGYRNIIEDRPCIQKQGGQGATRPRSAASINEIFL